MMTQSLSTQNPIIAIDTTNMWLHVALSTIKSAFVPMSKSNNEKDKTKLHWIKSAGKHVSGNLKFTVYLNSTDRIKSNKIR